MGIDMGFNIGDVLFEIGESDKFVVCGFDKTGMMLGQVICGQAYPANRWVGKSDYSKFVKVNRWSFVMDCEVEVSGEN